MGADIYSGRHTEIWTTDTQTIQFTNWEKEKKAMASIYDSLKQDLKAGKVILPGDADYDDSIKRWSASCVQPAVSSTSAENDPLHNNNTY